MINLRSLVSSFALAGGLSALGAQQPSGIPRPRGVEVSGLPALNFDADEGFGYGVIVALYDYGATGVPYRYTLQPTAFLTTKGRRDLTLFLDAPALLPRQWRLSAFVGREQQLATPYYGVGNASTYDSRLETNGSPYYYRFGRDRFRGSADVQHTLGHPAARILLGAGISREAIDLSPFDSGSTLISGERAGSTPPTGHINYARAGLIWDTRDNEIGTHSGTWADLLVQRVTNALGASNDYTRVTGTYRRYQPLGNRVTFAQRLVGQQTRGDVPFYDLAAIQTEFKPQDGLGGASTVRGLPKDRYAGKGLMLSNSELRWRAREFVVRGRESALVLSGFFDAGRVWPEQMSLSTALKDLHVGYGGGARFAYGSSFVVAVDVGHSNQATAPIYIGLGYMF